MSFDIQIHHEIIKDKNNGGSFQWEGLCTVGLLVNGKVNVWLKNGVTGLLHCKKDTAVLLTDSNKIKNTIMRWCPENKSFPYMDLDISIQTKKYQELLDFLKNRIDNNLLSHGDMYTLTGFFSLSSLKQEIKDGDVFAFYDDYERLQKEVISGLNKLGSNTKFVCYSNGKTDQSDYYFGLDETSLVSIINELEYLYNRYKVDINDIEKS